MVFDTLCIIWYLFICILDGRRGSMRLPNGFGSVHKLPGNRRNPYRVRITIGWKVSNERGKVQAYKTIGYFKTKEEGLIALSNFNESPYKLENQNITFAELYELWSKEHFENIVPSSRRTWIAAYNHSEKLLTLKFKDIRVCDLENSINHADVGTATKSRMKSLYNMMYRYAIKHEIVDKNYATYCEIPHLSKTFERVPFSDREIEKLWKNVDMPFVNMVLINIYTGLRPRELVELKNSNIDLKKKVMKGGLKTDAGRNRIIPIHEVIYPLISSLYNIQNERLCNKENGDIMSYDDYRNRFRKIMKALKMKHKPHDTRHTFVTLAKRCKVDEYVLKIVIGHKIKDLTERTYTHRLQKDINKEINKIKC